MRQIAAQGQHRASGSLLITTVRNVCTARRRGTGQHTRDERDEHCLLCKTHLPAASARSRAAPAQRTEACLHSPLHWPAAAWAAAPAAAAELPPQPPAPPRLLAAAAAAAARAAPPQKCCLLPGSYCTTGCGRRLLQHCLVQAPCQSTAAAAARASAPAWLAHPVARRAPTGAAAPPAAN